jgi:hypothetical protein
MIAFPLINRMGQGAFYIAIYLPIYFIISEINIFLLDCLSKLSKDQNSRKSKQGCSWEIASFKRCHFVGGSCGLVQGWR